MSRVIVMAKAPVAGYAKTRLMPALGAAGAAALATRLLHHAVAQARAALPGQVELCVAPDLSHAAWDTYRDAPDMMLSLQGEGDLGARMGRALDRALSLSSFALMIGTDAPLLDEAMLQQAAAALDTHDAVFVPAHDGGYALIGLRRPAPQLFTDMPWSTAVVMALTRERLHASGLRHAELPAVHDIDEPTDLIHLPEDWRA